jgi:small-conductance mechanosensitive channel
MSLIKSIYAAGSASINNPVLPNSETIASNPTQYVDNVIQSIINIFLIVAVIYFIWHFIMAAYHMISSNGDPKKWEQSQKAILYSLVGIMLAFSVFAVLKFAGILFGIDSLENLQLTWPTFSN